ncbi:MAG TPA: type II secretion system protein [Candidatus Omnitrophica bacterium]|nr:type II secretion system protein [Candidatus Omnitrophota bacterium]
MNIRKNRAQDTGAEEHQYGQQTNKKLETTDCRLWTKQGFTLLEVMVAVAILSLGLSVVIHSFSTSLQALDTSLNLSKVALLAQKKLSEIELEDFLTEGLTSGEFEEDYSDFSWQVEIHPLRIEEDIWQMIEETGESIEMLTELENNPVLYQVTITISWQTGDHERNMRFVTYLPVRFKQ